MTFEVKIARSAEHGVWYVQDSDIPGLRAEAATFDELVSIITDVAPDLVEANCPRSRNQGASSIPLRFEHLVDARSSAAG